MKISTKGRYALRVMLDIATQGTDRSIPLKEIAARQGITVKYLEQIIPPLNRAGYLHSARGNNGGYRLARRPEEYIVGDIIRVSEGSLAPLACLEDTENGCGRQSCCQARQFWAGLDRAIRDYVDSVTLADVMAYRPEETPEKE